MTACLVGNCPAPVGNKGALPTSLGPHPSVSQHHARRMQLASHTLQKPCCRKLLGARSWSSQSQLHWSRAHDGHHGTCTRVAPTFLSWLSCLLLLARTNTPPVEDARAGHPQVRPLLMPRTRIRLPQAWAQRLPCSCPRMCGVGTVRIPPHGACYRSLPCGRWRQQRCGRCDLPAGQEQAR